MAPTSAHAREVLQETQQLDAFKHQECVQMEQSVIKTQHANMLEAIDSSKLRYKSFF